MHSPKLGLLAVLSQWPEWPCDPSFHAIHLIRRLKVQFSGFETTQSGPNEGMQTATTQASTQMFNLRPFDRGYPHTKEAFGEVSAAASACFCFHLFSPKVLLKVTKQFEGEASTGRKEKALRTRTRVKHQGCQEGLAGRKKKKKSERTRADVGTERNKIIDKQIGGQTG